MEMCFVTLVTLKLNLSFPQIFPYNTWHAVCRMPLHHYAVLGLHIEELSCSVINSSYPFHIFSFRTVKVDFGPLLHAAVKLEESGAANQPGLGSLPRASAVLGQAEVLVAP